MSPRNEEQNTLIKDERHEQILSAALKVFARRGFAATKISDIIAQGGMSHGLVYHYFKSKEEIFFQLLDRALSTSGDSLLMVESMPISPLQKVRETAKYILGGIDQWEDTSYYFLIVIHAAMMDMSESDKVFSKSQVAIDVMVRILEQGQELGEVKDGDPLEMAILFFAAIQGVAFYKLSMPNFRLPDPELLVSMVKK
jgi:AcrR family transcriptional regulator